MSAELVDPFATPHEPGMLKAETVDHMLEDIRAAITQRPFRDIPNPELLPGFFHQLLRETAAAAAGRQVCCTADWAGAVLYDLWNHACTGTPYGEPQEPADLLDREQHLWPHPAPEHEERP